MCAHQVRPYVHLREHRRPHDRAGHPATPSLIRRATQHYEIRVGGHLGSRWSTWFDGLTLTNEDDGTSVIRGSVVDQAALHGLLQKLRDLGITLISLTPVLRNRPPSVPTNLDNQPHHHSPGATS